MPAAGWLDLSTGINPHPYPVDDLPATAWNRLPGADLTDAATRAAAAAFGARPDQVLACPGTSAAIQALPRLLARSRVAVVGPTYGEHARAWAACGHQVSEISGLDQGGDADIVVVVNPNNPTGTRHDPDRLRAQATTLAAKGGLLVVDEAFMDASPDQSVAGSVGPGLVVLRSFGKFHGLAGARLGFCLAEPALLTRMADQWGPWPVSGPALILAARALGDTAWAAATRARLGRLAADLDRVLVAAGLEIAGGTTLFRLARGDDAGQCHDRLGRAGILVRAFPSHPRWLRFGLPADAAQTARLAAALTT